MKCRTLVWGVVLALVLASNVLAQVPTMINYQGKLAKISGTLLDTTISMVFSIYADPITMTYLWRETQSDVAVESGIFSVLLGNVTPIPASVFDGSVLYLGVKVGSDAEMAPRRVITSVGYAYSSANADVWDGHDWGDTYPQVADANLWNGHSWGEVYPQANDAYTWDGYSWGETYPAASNADYWSGHTWGDTYPYAANSDLVDGYQASQFLLNSTPGGEQVLDGSLNFLGLNYVKFNGSPETIRYDGGGYSGHHGMLLAAHPTREIIFGSIWDNGAYAGTRSVIGPKGDMKLSGSMELQTDGTQPGKAALLVAGKTALSLDGEQLKWGQAGEASVFLGSVGIGIENPEFDFDVSGSAHASTFSTTSDIRLKTDVTQLTDVLEKLVGLRGVSFEWNERCEEMGRATGRREIGVIAQEVEEVFPELVSTWGDQQYRAVDYGKLTAVLIEAVKELKKENDDLRQRIERIEEHDQR